jgi:hypothetical protein
MGTASGAPDARVERDSGTDEPDARAPRDGGPRPDAGPRSDGGPPPEGRELTNAEVLFEGTELDLGRQYGLYVQDDRSSIDIAGDPLGIFGDVIRYRHFKDSNWTHTMVRPGDARTDYREGAQVRAYEAVYRYRQDLLVTADPQWSEPSMNLLEDFHCEPCEANTLQIMLNYDGDGSLCLWIAYSTDPDFDPRGPNRGGRTDPWELLGENRFYLQAGPDGRPDLEEALPETASILLCRDDVRTEDLFGRWVEVEMIVRPSSYDTGTIRAWIDGRPYRFDGPNNYRWNQDRPDPLPVNTFQIGLYGSQLSPQDGAPEHFEIFTTPPRIELGDGIAGE